MPIEFDCKKAHKKIIKLVLKYNECAQEAGSEIVMIRKFINKIKFNVTL